MPALIIFFEKFSFLFVSDKKVILSSLLRFIKLSLNTGPIIIFTPVSANSLAASKVISGFDFVSLGKISIDGLSILLMANLTDLIIDCPISEFLPVNGASKPILIFSLALIFPKLIEKTIV